jgi:Ribosomal protein L11 methyltransferase (PrmA)
MKKQLMHVMETLPVFGDLYRKLERRFFFRYVKRIRADAGARLALASNNTVKAGVFAGMKIHPQSAFGVDQFTILSGQYESELYEIISAAAAKNYDAFIDIGCANGFYAVGFAMISDNCDVIAYDISSDARRVTELNAKMNSVADRIVIKNAATHSELGDAIQQRKKAFLLVDIEGAELDLLDPQKCPPLSQCDLLIEVHGRTDEVADILLSRFEKTHSGRLIGRSPRNPFAFDYLPLHFEDEAWVIVSEGRRFVKNNWLFLEKFAHEEVNQKEV